MLLFCISLCEKKSWTLSLVYNKRETERPMVEHCRWFVVVLFNPWSACTWWGRWPCWSSRTHCRTTRWVWQTCRWEGFQPWRQRWRNGCHRQSQKKLHHPRCIQECPSRVLQPQPSPWLWCHRKTHPCLVWNKK